MDIRGLSEILVNVCQPTQRHIPEDSTIESYFLQLFLTSTKFIDVVDRSNSLFLGNNLSFIIGVKRNMSLGLFLIVGDSRILFKQTGERIM
jgi:hypothetical protein